jgi:hypothetical protein
MINPVRNTPKKNGGSGSLLRALASSQTDWYSRTFSLARAFTPGRWDVPHRLPAPSGASAKEAPEGAEGMACRLRNPGVNAWAKEKQAAARSPCRYACVPSTRFGEHT